MASTKILGRGKETPQSVEGQAWGLHSRKHYWVTQDAVGKYSLTIVAGPQAGHQISAMLCPD